MAPKHPSELLDMLLLERYGKLLYLPSVERPIVRVPSLNLLFTLGERHKIIIMQPVEDVPYVVDLAFHRFGDPDLRNARALLEDAEHEGAATIGREDFEFLLG